MSCFAEKVGKSTPSESVGFTAKRRVSCRTRVDRPNVNYINDCWAMDFMSGELFDGRQIRLLTIVDHFTRESLAIEVGQRMRGREVVTALAFSSRSIPLKIDSGSTTVPS